MSSQAEPYYDPAPGVHRQSHTALSDFFLIVVFFWAFFLLYLGCRDRALHT